MKKGNMAAVGGERREWDAAEAAGVPVSIRSAPPAQMDGLEVWAVNALHGIRPVTAWAGTGIVPGPADRAPRWQAYLDELADEAWPKAAAT